MPTIFGSPLPPGKEGSTKGEIRIRVDKLLLDEDALLQFQEELNEKVIQPRSVVSESPSPSRSRPSSPSPSRIPSKLSSSSGAAGGGTYRSPNRFVIPVDHCAVAPLFSGEPFPSAYCIPATASEARGGFTLVYPIKDESDAFSEYLNRIARSPHHGLQVEVFVPSSYSGRRAFPVGKASLDLKELAPRRSISGWFTLGTAMLAKKSKLKEDGGKPFREVQRGAKKKTLPESTTSNAKQGKEQVPLDEKGEGNDGERKVVENHTNVPTSSVIVPIGRVKLCISLNYFSRPQVLEPDLSIEGTHLVTPPRDRGIKNRSPVAWSTTERMEAENPREAGRTKGGDRENPKAFSSPSHGLPHSVSDGGIAVPVSSDSTSKTSPTPLPTSSTSLASPPRAYRNEGGKAGDETEQQGFSHDGSAATPAATSSWMPAGVATVAALSRGTNHPTSVMSIGVNRNNSEESCSESSSPHPPALSRKEGNADLASGRETNQAEHTLQYGLASLPIQQPSLTVPRSSTKEEVLEKVWQQGQQLQAKMREALKGADETMPPLPNAMSLLFSSPSASSDAENGITGYRTSYTASDSRGVEGQEMPHLPLTSADAAALDAPPSSSAGLSFGVTFPHPSLPPSEQLQWKAGDNVNTDAASGSIGWHTGGVRDDGSQACGIEDSDITKAFDMALASSTAVFHDRAARDTAEWGKGDTDSASVTSTLYTSENSDEEERFTARLRRDLEDAEFRRSLGDSNMQYAESRRVEDARCRRERNGEGGIGTDGKRVFASSTSPYGNRQKHLGQSYAPSPFRDAFTRHPTPVPAHVSLTFSRISFPHNPFTADVEELRINVRLSQDISTAYPSPGPFSSLVHPLPLAVQHSICLRFDVSGFSENSKLVVEFLKVRSRPVTVPGRRLLPSGVSTASPSSTPLPPSREVIGETPLGLCIVGLYQQEREIALENPLQNVTNAYAHFSLLLDPISLDGNLSWEPKESGIVRMDGTGKRKARSETESESARREGKVEEKTGLCAYSHPPLTRRANDQRREGEVPSQREMHLTVTHGGGEAREKMAVSPLHMASPYSTSEDHRNDVPVGYTGESISVPPASTSRGKEVSLCASQSPHASMHGIEHTPPKVSGSSSPLSREPRAGEAVPSRSSRAGERAPRSGERDRALPEEEDRRHSREQWKETKEGSSGRRRGTRLSSAAMVDSRPEHRTNDERATNGSPSRQEERREGDGRGHPDTIPLRPSLRAAEPPAISSASFSSPPQSSPFSVHPVEEHTRASAAGLPSTTGAGHFHTTAIAAPAAYLPTTRPAGRCRFHIAIMGARDIPLVGVVPKGSTAGATFQGFAPAAAEWHTAVGEEGSHIAHTPHVYSSLSDPMRSVTPHAPAVQGDFSITQTAFCRPNIFFVIEEIFSGVDNDVASTGAVPDWLVEACTGGYFDRTEVAYDSTHPAFQYESIVSLPQESVWLSQSRSISTSSLRHAAAMMATVERPFAIHKKKTSHGETVSRGNATDASSAAPHPATRMKSRNEGKEENDSVAAFQTLSRHSKIRKSSGGGKHRFPRPCLRELQITMWHSVDPGSASYCPPLHEGQSEEEVFWSNAAYIGECRVDLRPLKYLPALQGYYRITATGHPPLLNPPKVPTLSSTCMGHVHLAISMLPSDEEGG